jgi:hypothetical protein
MNYVNAQSNTSENQPNEEQINKNNKKKIMVLVFHINATPNYMTMFYLSMKALGTIITMLNSLYF